MSRKTEGAHEPTVPHFDLVGGVQLFHRASEVQELYFYLFILLYLIVLYRRLPVFRRPAGGKAPG